MILYYLQQLCVCSEQKCTDKHLRREVPVFSYMQQGNFFSKYAILFDGKSKCVGHFRFTGFGKNILIFCRILCWQFVINFFSEVYLFVCLFVHLLQTEYKQQPACIGSG